MIKMRVSLMLLIMVTSITCFTNGCGSSHGERQTKNEVERKELVRKNEEKEKSVMSQLVNKHNAVYFPPESLGPTAFTYEFQEFFKIHSQRAFVFKGYLEDIEQTENGIIVEFLCPLGENYFVDKKAIRFRLTISEDSVKQFFRREQEDPLRHSLRYLFSPDYYVVARVKNVKSYRIYRFDGTDNGEEVEIDSDISRSFISSGWFIDAVGISKN